MKEIYHWANHGDKKAIESVLKELEPILSHIAQRYYTPGMDKDDIMQILRTGAWQAMTTFNAKKVADKKTDVGRIFLLWTIRLAEQYLWRDFRGRDPERRGHKATKELTECISLEQSIDRSRESSMKVDEIIADIKVKAPLDIVSDKEESRIINSLIERLTKEEKLVIELHYTHGMSFSSIGKELTKSKQWIFTVHQKALKHLEKWWEWEKKYGLRLTSDIELKITRRKKLNI